VVALSAGVAEGAKHRVCTSNPCYGSHKGNILYERRGEGTPDTIYGRGGGDYLGSGEHEHGHDKDVLYGGAGRDWLEARDKDNKDRLYSGPGNDVCYADYKVEVVSGCEDKRMIHDK
jgi:Ca2+-binding RTX toxin-like protein